MYAPLPDYLNDPTHWFLPAERNRLTDEECALYDEVADLWGARVAGQWKRGLKPTGAIS